MNLELNMTCYKSHLISPFEFLTAFSVINIMPLVRFNLQRRVPKVHISKYIGCLIIRLYITDFTDVQCNGEHGQRSNELLLSGVLKANEYKSTIVLGLL